ncbi:GNAT family N-acetyltransferase [Levilactobacillus tangyuanensis]|uniref:GNAT family N-acetyltransferase n=1 Tax=Levilactobacillus tangyuanensis TaxID=2486021 RepID=A0ABW1TN13_9LACO|nr:GNAT family protein [Levilactobacillus tangyuanensis]
MKDVVQGQLVHLTEMRDGDAEWLQDTQWEPGLLRNLSADALHPVTAAQYSELAEYPENNDQFFFMVRANADDGLLGSVILNNVLFKNRRATLGIALPVVSDRGQGYGVDTLNTILSFAFNELGLHKVNLEVNANNLPAIHAYEAVGFIREGVNREAVFQDGRWLDLYQYGILASDWTDVSRETSADGID